MLLPRETCWTTALFSQPIVSVVLLIHSWTPFSPVGLWTPRVDSVNRIEILVVFPTHCSSV